MFHSFKAGSVDVQVESCEIVRVFLQGNGLVSDKIGCQKDGIGRGLHVSCFGDVEGKKGV